MLATRTCLQHTGESFRGYIKANSLRGLLDLLGEMTPLDIKGSGEAKL